MPVPKWLKKQYPNLKEEFKQWQIDNYGKSESMANTNCSDAYFLCNKDMDAFVKALNDSEQTAETALKNHFNLHPQKSKPTQWTIGWYFEVFKILKEFFIDRHPEIPKLLEKFGYEGHELGISAIATNVGFTKDKLKAKNNEKHSVKKVEQQSKNKPMPTKEPHEIFQRAMKKIKDINRKSKNRNEGSIFNPSVYEYVEEIEESYKSFSQFKNLTEYLYRIIFKDFILNLYIIIYETTREKNPNRKPPYDYKLHKFLIDGKPIKDFFYIVGTLRHHYAHLEPEYKDKVSINKKSYGDVLKKLLGSRDEPKSRGDFQRLQIEVLKLFEEAMESLLEMLKDD